MIKNTDAAEKITAYIEALPSWSRILCAQLRQLIIEADPSLTEEWKWGPHYSSNGMVCGYGAFKKHVKVTFFNGAGLTDKAGLFNHCVDAEFSRSIKFEKGDKLNKAQLTVYIQEAVALNKKGFKRQVADKTVTVPGDLLAALQGNATALLFFEGLSYGYKKEFIEQVTGAKQDATRQARIAKVVDHCASGKRLNDKYKK